MSNPQDFLDNIQSLIAQAGERTEDRKKLAVKKATKSIGIDSDVTFNVRLNKGLRDEFDKLCKQNDTNMSREVKRYMRLAVLSQKLLP